jgi:hypothetical protein
MHVTTLMYIHAISYVGFQDTLHHLHITSKHGILLQLELEPWNGKGQTFDKI